MGRNLPRELEAVLFVTGAPTTAEDLAEVLEVTVDEALTAGEALRQSLAEADRGIRLASSPEGLQLVSAPDLSFLVERALTAGMREKLTPAAAETLAIIAYRGPISRAGVEGIRGVNSAFTLRLLALRGLVVRRPHPTDRRRFVYLISAEFLRHLGTSRLEDLPDYAMLRAHDGLTALAASGEPVGADG